MDPRRELVSIQDRYLVGCDDCRPCDFEDQLYLSREVAEQAAINHLFEHPLEPTIADPLCTSQPNIGHKLHIVVVSEVQVRR